MDPRPDPPEEGPEEPAAGTAWARVLFRRPCGSAPRYPRSGPGIGSPNRNHIEGSRTGSTVVEPGSMTAAPAGTFWASSDRPGTDAEYPAQRSRGEDVAPMIGGGPPARPGFDGEAVDELGQDLGLPGQVAAGGGGLFPIPAFCWVL